jgi:hypothetical protein
MASPLRLEDYEVTELYQAQDPEVVITEMRAKGNRHDDGPVVRGDVHPDPPDPGRSYCAMARLRRPPGPGEGVMTNGTILPSLVRPTADH